MTRRLVWTACDIHRLHNGVWAEAPANSLAGHPVVIWYYLYPDGRTNIKSVWLWGRRGAREATRFIDRPGMEMVLHGLMKIVRADAFRRMLLDNKNFVAEGENAEQDQG